MCILRVIIIIITILILNAFSVLGDPRTNQNPAILTLSILFFRWHNVVAARVQHQHPDWTDEDVFQRSRRIVIGTIQVSVLEINVRLMMMIDCCVCCLVIVEYHNVRVFAGVFG